MTFREWASVMRWSGTKLLTTTGDRVFGFLAVFLIVPVIGIGGGLALVIAYNSLKNAASDLLASHPRLAWVGMAWFAVSFAFTWWVWGNHAQDRARTVQSALDSDLEVKL